MSKHTPGPWMAREVTGSGFPGQSGWAIDFNEDQEQVVDYVYEAADAHLIAAAPDLLWALYQAVTNEEQKRFEYWLDRVRPSGDCDSVHAQWVASGDYADFCYGWKLQLDAIAKARGEA